LDKRKARIVLTTRFVKSESERQRYDTFTKILHCSGKSVELKVAALTHTFDEVETPHVSSFIQHDFSPERAAWNINLKLNAVK
jgi:hypothetical protein